jgi:hypothetical protein
VAAVAVELGPAAVVQCSLDGERMQAELLAQHREAVVVGSGKSSQTLTKSSAR